METVIISALLFGINAGVSPGPLFTIVITETLKNGFSGGVRVAVAPLITDIPILLLSLYFFSFHFNLEPLTLGAIINLAGGLILLWIGSKDFRTKEYALHVAPGKSELKNSFKKGILTNVTNPSPYIFWILIFPSAVSGYSTAHIIVFVLLFLFTVTGIKIIISYLISRYSIDFIKRYLLAIVRGSGIILILFGINFIAHAILYFVKFI